MEQYAFVQSWCDNLPNGLFVSYGSIESEISFLSYNEAISIGSVNNLRMLEFASGRLHARNALEQMGIYSKDLPKDKLTGATIWPKGVVGSIAHTKETNKSLVAAVVASSEKFDLLGIDVEYNSLIHPSIWSLFLTTKDLELVALAPVDEKNKLVSKFWSLKEAAIKATGQGEMTSWAVSKSNSTNKFILTYIYKKLELEGIAIIEKSLVLALAYMYKKNLSDA